MRLIFIAFGTFCGGAFPYSSQLRESAALVYDVSLHITNSYADGFSLPFVYINAPRRLLRPHHNNGRIKKQCENIKSYISMSW